MSLLTESKAQFKSRAAEVGVSDATMTVIVASGIDTMSKLAFWVNQPGTAVDDVASRLLLCRH